MMIQRQTIADDLAFKPPVDVFEREGQLIIDIDVPGVQKNQLRVTVSSDHIAVSGSRASHWDDTIDVFHHCERDYGSFYRLVPLPPGAHVDEVNATLSGGVLHVTVPLAAKAHGERQRVVVEAAAPKAA